MDCPTCRVAMLQHERVTRASDVVVLDVCPRCGGIWLDRGELEKLSDSERRYYRLRSRDDDDEDEDFDRRRTDPGRKRRGFLGSLFEGFE